MRRLLSVLFFVISIAGCSVAPKAPSSLGEASSAYTYVPLDGLAVDQTKDADSCKEKSVEFKDLLASLPDISVRFAVSERTAGANAGFGPVKITTEGASYKAVLDYVNNDAVPVTFFIRKIVENAQSKNVSYIRLSSTPAEDQRVSGYEAKISGMAGKKVGDMTFSDAVEERFEEVTIPVYVGIGLRVTADVVALKGGISISSLGGIGANAEGLTGGLTVQTIGINGTLIGGSIPTPNKLDQTTVENAVLAIGSSRTAIYADTNNQNVNLTPRVVGLYSPIGSDPALINSIYSELARVRPRWNRPCQPTGS